MKKAGETEVLRCSFCNKDQNDVRKLIAGPTVFICDECVEVCNDIIADDKKTPTPKAKGKRFSLPNSRILIHQPLMQGLGGQATDIDIAAREILRMRERLNSILVQHTGQSEKRIQDDTERDYIMTADQGKEYGIIDDVIRKRA